MLPCGAFSPESCRCVKDKLYRLAVTFTNTTAAIYLVTGISLTATFRGITFPPGQAKPFLPGSSTVVFEFTSTSNASTVQLTLVYTLTNRALARSRPTRR